MKMQIEKARKLVKESKLSSFNIMKLLGYFEALDDYSIYKDGERYIGALNTPLSDVLKRKLAEYKVMAQ